MLSLVSKKTKYVISIVLGMLLIASFLIPAEGYAAAAKYQFGFIDVGNSAEDGTKVGNRYFWYDSDHDTGKRILYTAKSYTGSKTKLDSTSETELIEAAIGEEVLYNGSKVYYTKMQVNMETGENKTEIYSVSPSGRNKKKIKTLTYDTPYTFAKIYKIYNNKLYYVATTMDEETGLFSKGMLYSLDLETKKTKKLSSNFLCYDQQNTSRYIYGGTDDYNVVIYDCKEGKTIKKMESAMNLAVGTDYIVYAKGEDEVTLYKASASGSNAKKLKTFDNDNEKYIDHSRHEAYFYSFGENVFRYDFDTNKIEGIIFADR